MQTSEKDFLRQLLSHMESIDYLKAEDIPGIDLYMDQVTTFMEQQLAPSKRHDDDKILTKTMINNYSKNDLLPPPEKKKYSKEHMLTLIFIYYFKNILSINDIKTILNPITEKYFGNVDGKDMEDVYSQIFALEREESNKLLHDLMKKFNRSFESFSDFPEEDRDYLHKFSFFCMLSYDVYVKKRILEQMVDDLLTDPDSKQ